MTLIKWTSAILVVLVIACFHIAYALPTWIGTDAEPGDQSGTTSANYCYIYRTDVAAENGEVTKIEVFCRLTGGGTIDFGVFSKNGNDFTDEEYVEGLTLVNASLNTYDAPGDFTAMPISVGQYIGMYANASGALERDDSSGPGYWFDEGDVIGDGIASTFSESATTRDIQMRFYVTSTGPAPEGGAQVIIIGSIDEDILRHYAVTD